MSVGLRGGMVRLRDGRQSVHLYITPSVGLLPAGQATCGCCSGHCLRAWNGVLHGMSVGVEWDCVCSFGAKLLGSRMAECGFNLRVSRGTGVDYLTSRFDPMMCGLGFVERSAREGDG